MNLRVASGLGLVLMGAVTLAQAYYALAAFLLLAGYEWEPDRWKAEHR